MFYKIRAGSEIITLGKVGQGKGRRNCSEEVMLSTVAKKFRVVEAVKVDVEQGIVYWKGNCGWLNATSLENVEPAVEGAKKSGRPRKAVTSDLIWTPMVTDTEWSEFVDRYG